MSTLTIELISQKALKLIQNLEELNIIRVLKTDIENKEPQASLAEKYAGRLSKKTGDELLEHVTKSREEWDRNF